MLKVNLSGIEPFIKSSNLKSIEKDIKNNLNLLLSKKGKGNDFLGWVNLPSSISKEYLNELKTEANKLRVLSEVVVVIGIGGSYLGTKAINDMLIPSFQDGRKGNPKLIYAGHNLDSDYMHDLLDYLNEKEFSIVVISKSGTTTEPAIAFRLLKNKLIEKYGQYYNLRIVAITDEKRGALKNLAIKENYKTFIIPDDLGGRFSVLSAVGLFPLAIAGINIEEIIKGAVECETNCKSNKFIENPAMQYAAARNILYNSGKKIEILASFNPSLQYLIEWWKQLFGESEGKEGKGIFPAGVIFTTDLHSMGQYIQDGERIIFETVIRVNNSKNKIIIETDVSDEDGLNYLASKDINWINSKAELGTRIAHIDGGVPNILIEVDSINEKTIGEMIYFFEMSCGLSAYLLDVNPFNQPGVEDYKTNMFALLEKPGFEKLTKEIKKRI